MTADAPLYAPLSVRFSAAAIGRHARDAIAALGLLCAATLVQAEVNLQDWIPQVLAFPSDAEVVTDREIGSSVRLFSVRTAEETGPLLRDWQETLRENGYAIQQDADELLDNALEFSGPGIANAKIVANRTDEDGQTVIEFDATLN